MVETGESTNLNYEPAEVQLLSIDDQFEMLEQATLNPVRPSNKLRTAWQRGMTTAEYAVGILAAVAFALVLLKIISGKEFFGAMLKFVISLIGKISGMLP